MPETRDEERFTVILAPVPGSGSPTDTTDSCKVFSSPAETSRFSGPVMMKLSVFDSISTFQMEDDIHGFLTGMDISPPVSSMSKPMFVGHTSAIGRLLFHPLVMFGPFNAWKSRPESVIFPFGIRARVLPCNGLGGGSEKVSSSGHSSILLPLP